MRNLMLAGCLLASIQANAVTTWQVSGEAGDQAQTNSVSQNTAKQTATLVFVRSNANPDPDSSTNLSINGRYLTSLQDGHYATAVVCAGTNLIGAVPTLALTNDLTTNSFEISLAKGATQTLLVEIGQDAKPVLRALEPVEAQALLAKTRRQTHLVSRSFAKDCKVVY